MDDFGTIRLHKKVIEKFKMFSKTVSTNYSETLDYMIAFFKDNDLTPFDVARMGNAAFVNRFNRRMDAVIAIFRNVEKTQLIPTRLLLESLFEDAKEEMQTYNFGKPELIKENEAIVFYREQYFKQQEKYNEFKKEMTEFMDKVVYEKRHFGKDYFKLNISKNEFENFRNKNNV